MFNYQSTIRKKRTMAQQSTKVVTGKVRLSYAHVFEPYGFDDGDSKKYSTVLLIPKGDKKTLKALRDAQQIALENGKAKFNGKIPTTWADTIRDGDEEKDIEEHPEYAGCYFMSASTTVKPGVVDRNVQPILDTSEVYSGCYARVSLVAFAYNMKGKKGVSFILGHIQKMEDGEPLGGGAGSAEDDFEPLDDDDDDDLV